MLDEDDAPVDGAANAASPRFQSLLDEARKLTTPFDMVRYADENPFIFEMGDPEGNLLGRFAHFHGGEVTLLNGEAIVVDPSIGEIVAQAYGRVVIAFDHAASEYIYVGWLNPDDYDLIDNFYIPEPQQWNH